MSANGTPFVAIMRWMMSRFQRTLAELDVRHIRTQIDTPWTNGKIEAFWAILRSEVLDRQHLADLAAAEADVFACATEEHHLACHDRPSPRCGRRHVHSPASAPLGSGYGHRP